MKRIIVSSILIITASLMSCDKESSLPDRFTLVAADQSNIRFLNMSPDAPAMNLYNNGVKLTSATPTGTNAVSGIPFPAVYPANVGYALITGGTTKLELKVPDSSALMPGVTLLMDNKTFEPGKFYTYAVLNSLSKLSTLMVEDDPSVPDISVSYFRLANFVPNSPVKIEFQKTSTGPGAVSKTYSSVAFKNVSPFDTLTAGAIYKVYLKNPATDARLDSISAFTPAASKKYTIYARGVMGLPVSNAKRPIITNYATF